MEKFGTILTSIGLEAITECMTTGTKLDIKHMAVGDSNGAYYEPTEAQTELRRERWRGAALVGAVADNMRRIVVTAIVPANIGGFAIREAGIFDGRGRMIAVCKYALTEKPEPSSGATKETHIQMVVDVVNAGTVNITVDPTAAYVLCRDFEAYKEYVTTLNATKAPINNPDFTGTAKLNNKEIPTVESGMFANLKLTNSNREHEAVFENYSANYKKVGGLVYVQIAFKLKSKGTLVGSEGIYLRGLPFPTAGYSSLSVTWWAGATSLNGFGGEASGTSVNLYKPINDGVLNVRASDITDEFTIEDLAGCYITNY